MKLDIKICGLNTIASVEAAAMEGVDYIGCVFNINSASYISPLTAREITKNLSDTIQKVAVVSNSSNSKLEEIVFYFTPDFIQFHGSETPEFLSLIKERTNCKIIKSIFISAKSDLKEIKKYEKVCDMILIEPIQEYLDKHKQPKKFFDWNMLKKIDLQIPYIISGNISKHNLPLILRLSKTKIVNVDMALESSLGVKDPALIHDFMVNVKKWSENEFR